MNNNHYNRYPILPSMVSEEEYKAYTDSDIVVWQHEEDTELFCITYNVQPDDYNKAVEGSFERITAFLAETWENSFIGIHDPETSAAALIDGGWSSADIEEIKAEYGLNDEDGETLEREMKRLEQK